MINEVFFLEMFKYYIYEKKIIFCILIWVLLNDENKNIILKIKKSL